ncbi:MAG: glycosyltransferase family 9 protein [Rhodospirillaceae bacterium]|nr:glycosyltransferase family 9 protein [Rhodospirillaceae bacterium]
MQLLFIGPTRVGDAVLSSGVLAWMLARWPEASVTVAAGPAAAPLYAAVPRLSELIVLRKRPLAGHWRDLWLHTVGRFWTAIADTRRSAVSRLVPARRRFVMGSERPGLHKVLQASAMVGAPQPLAPRIWLRTEHREAARLRIPDGPPVLALAPTANWGGKQWPADRFVALAEGLASPGGPLPGARIAVFAGPGERDAAAPVLRAVAAERRIDLAGTLDLLTAAACLERAALFVGNDSGLMHLAAAMGTPTLGLFGPSREEHYGPWGERAQAVRTDLTYDQILATTGYDHRRHDTHMESLSVAKAVAAAVSLLDRCRAPANAA